MNKYFKTFAYIQVAIAAVSGLDCKPVNATQAAYDQASVPAATPVPVTEAPTPVPVSEAPLSRVAAVADGHVCLYTEEQFQGNHVCLTSTNKLDLCSSRFGGCENAYNEKIKSVKFGNGVEYLKVYKNSGFRSYYGLLTKDTPVLPTTWLDATSFLVTRPVELATKVCLYKETEFQGARTCVDVATTGNLNSDFNDQVRSIQFGTDVSAFKMWKDFNRETYHGAIGSSRTTLEAKYHSFSSWRVIQKSPDNQVCCFTKPYYEGARHSFAKGDHNSVGSALNDKIQSIRFGAGVSAINLYKHTGLAQFLGTFTTSIEELSSSQDDTSSLKVF